MYRGLMESVNDVIDVTENALELQWRTYQNWLTGDNCINIIAQGERLARSQNSIMQGWGNLDRISFVQLFSSSV